MRHYLALCLILLNVQAAAALERGTVPSRSDRKVVRLLSTHPEEPSGMCSGALLGCGSVVTAKHCVDAVAAECEADLINPADCYRQWLTVERPRSGGFVRLPVLRVELHPERDLALVRVGTSASGLRASSCASAQPSAAYVGHGYGPTNNAGGGAGVQHVQTGIKEFPPFSDPAVLRTEADTTCQGDSGGPLRNDANDAIVGVFSIGDGIGWSGPCGYSGSQFGDSAARIDPTWLRSALSARVDAVGSTSLGFAHDGVAEYHEGSPRPPDCSPAQGTIRRSIVEVELTAEQSRALVLADCRLEHAITLSISENYLPGAEVVGASVGTNITVSLDAVDLSGDEVPIGLHFVETETTAGSSGSYADTTVHAGAPDELRGFLAERADQPITLRATIDVEFTPGCQTVIIEEGEDSADGDILLWFGQATLRVAPDFNSTETPFLEAGCAADAAVCSAPLNNCMSWPGANAPRPSADAAYACPSSPDVDYQMGPEMVLFGLGSDRRHWVGCRSEVVSDPDYHPASGAYVAWHTPNLQALTSLGKLDEFVGCVASRAVADGKFVFKEAANLGNSPMADYAMAQLVACGCEFERHPATRYWTGHCP